MKADLYRLELPELLTLALHYWACVKEERVGATGLSPFQDVMGEISRQSEILLSREQLEDLVYHYKQSVCEQLDPVKLVALKKDEYNSFVERLQSHIPELFRTTEFGEVVFKQDPNEEVLL